MTDLGGANLESSPDRDFRGMGKNEAQSNPIMATDENTGIDNGSDFGGRRNRQKHTMSDSSSQPSINMRLQKKGASDQSLKRTMEAEGTTDSLALPPIGTSAMINDKSSDNFNLNNFINEYAGKGNSNKGNSELYKTPDRANI